MSARDIFEYDLTKFFDRVNIQYITERLVGVGTPRDIAIMFENINKSTAKSENLERDSDIREREMIASASPSTIRVGGVIPSS